MDSWFVFFVQTGKEEKVCKHLNDVFSNGEFVSFIPKIELVYKKSKKICKEFKPMFPSYVFASTKTDGKDFFNLTVPIMRSNKDIIKLLGKEHPNHMAIQEKEKAFLLRFCDDEYIIRKSLGFIEGDRVFVTSGPLQGRESIIKRIDRHKRRAEIELEFMGDVRITSVAIEIINKV